MFFVLKKKKNKKNMDNTFNFQFFLFLKNTKFKKNKNDILYDFKKIIPKNIFQILIFSGGYEEQWTQMSQAVVGDWISFQKTEKYPRLEDPSE